MSTDKLKTVQCRLLHRILICITSKANTDKLAMAVQIKVLVRKMDSDLPGCWNNGRKPNPFLEAKLYRIDSAEQRCGPITWDEQQKDFVVEQTEALLHWLSSWSQGVYRRRFVSII